MFVKKTIGWCGVFCCILGFGAGKGFGADSVRLVGKALFEHRTQNAQNTGSQWSLVVKDGATSYELEKPISTQDSAPDSVELRGVVVRPGSQLVMDATVETRDPDYSIITDVKNISVIMDVDPDLGDNDVSRWFHGNPMPDYGWACRSADTTVPIIYANVIYAGQKDAASIYQLHISMDHSNGGQANVGQGPGEFPLATIDSASFKQDGSNLVYFGQSRTASAELSIGGQGGTQATDFPATLSVSRIKVFSDDPIVSAQGTISSQVSLICNRTRQMSPGVE